MLKHKKSLLASGLALLVCFALLMGATFAWFTDSVSNTGNRIEAGELKIDFYWFKWDKDAGQFTQVGMNEWAGTGKMSAENWEPGQSDALLVRVDSMGTLASKLRLRFDVVEDSGLSEALWFNVKTGKDYGQMITTQPTQGPVYSNDDTVTCMSELESWEDPFNTVLVGNPSTNTETEWRTWYLIEYGMYADAGSEYMNGSIDIDIHFDATQAPVEEDGFGDNQYDAMADYAVTTAEEFDKALADAQDGETISMDSGLVITEPVAIDNAITIYGNGATIANKVAIDAEGVVLSNLNIEVPMTTAEQAAPIVTNNQDLTLVGCEVTRTTEEAQPYGYLVNVGSGVLTAKDTVFTAPYDPETAFSASPSVIEAQGGVDLDGCVIATDGYGLFSQHVTTGTIKDTVFTGIDGRPTLGVFNSTLLDGLVFDGCTFDMGLNSTVAAGNFTVRNCVFDFTNTPADGAGNALNVYSENGPVVIENNTFRFSASSQRGVNLTWADWAQGSHDAANVTISGNTFEGTGECAIRVTNVWGNVADPAYPDNTFHGTVVTVEP